MYQAVLTKKVKKPPACQQCRRRKIGCDRGKPICGNCLKQGKTDCFYPKVPGGASADYTSLNGQVGQLPTDFTKAKFTVDKSSKSKQSGYKNSILPGENGSHRRLELELSTVEKLREYQTALQLFNAHNPDSLATSSSYDNYKLGAFRSSNYLNWHEDSAEYDIMTTTMTQEEVIDKEMEYLKDRLAELKSYALDRRLISTKDSELNSSNSKKRSFEEVTQDDNIYDDEDGEFLLRPIFDYQLPQASDTLIVKEVFNALYSPSFLMTLDNVLLQFFGNTLGSFNEEQMAEFKKLKVEKKAGLDVEAVSQSSLIIPSSNTLRNIGDFYFDVAIPSKYFDLLNKNEYDTLIPSSHKSDSAISINGLSIDDIAAVGILSIIALIVFEALLSMNDLSRSQKSLFELLKQNYESLIANLFLVKNELNFKNHSLQSMRVLKFYIFMKFFDSISVSRNMVNANDNDEDIYLARALRINNCSNSPENEEKIHIWNILLRLYQDRKLNKGTIPIYSQDVNDNSTNVTDSLLLKNLPFYDAASSLVDYLMIRDARLSSLELAERVNNVEKTIASNKLECINTPHFLLNDYNCWLLGKTSVLSVQYFQLLGIEAERLLSPAQHFSQMQSIIEHVKDALLHSLFYNTSGISENFMYLTLNKALTSVESACLITFGILQRCRLQLDSFDDNEEYGEPDNQEELNETKELEETNNHKKEIIRRIVEKLEDVLKKVYCYLVDWATKSEGLNLKAANLAKKLRIFIKYFLHTPKESFTPDIDWKEYLSERVGEIDIEAYRKLYYLSENLSEKLMNSVVYEGKSKQLIHESGKFNAPLVDESILHDFFEAFF